MERPVRDGSKKVWWHSKARAAPWYREEREEMREEGSTGRRKGREEATMDREEKVVGSVCKSRRWVDRLDGWIEGIPRRRWVCGGGGMGRMGQDP